MIFFPIQSDSLEKVKNSSARKKENEKKKNENFAVEMKQLIDSFT